MIRHFRRINNETHQIVAAKRTDVFCSKFEALGNGVRGSDGSLHIYSRASLQFYRSRKLCLRQRKGRKIELRIFLRTRLAENNAPRAKEGNTADCRFCDMCGVLLFTLHCLNHPHSSRGKKRQQRERICRAKYLPRFFNARPEAHTHAQTISA